MSNIWRNKEQTFLSTWKLFDTIENFQSLICFFSLKLKIPKLQSKKLLASSFSADFMFFSRAWNLIASLSVEALNGKIEKLKNLEEKSFSKAREKSSQASEIKNFKVQQFLSKKIEKKAFKLPKSKSIIVQLTKIPFNLITTSCSYN